MDTNRLRTVSAVAAVAVGLLLIGSYLAWNDALVSSIGVASLLIGVAAWFGT